MEGGGRAECVPPWTERRPKSLDWIRLKVMLKLFYFPLFNHFIVFSSHDDTTASLVTKNIFIEKIVQQSPHFIFSKY